MRAQKPEPTRGNLADCSNRRFSQRDQDVGSAVMNAGCAGRHGLAAVQQPGELRQVAHFRCCEYFENSSSQLPSRTVGSIAARKRVRALEPSQNSQVGS
jgi:hypothetical protein